MTRSFLGCCAAAFLPTIAFLATNVAAHGYVQSILVSGKNMTGPKPVDQASVQKLQTPIRQIASEQPIVLDSQGVTSGLLACGASGNVPASELASVAAGSSLMVQVRVPRTFPLVSLFTERCHIFVQWVNGGGGIFWPHNTGPLMAYMAACQKTDCSDDPSTLDFFKVSEAGQTTPGGTVWAQNELYEGHPIQVDTYPRLALILSHSHSHAMLNTRVGFCVLDHRTLRHPIWVLHHETRSDQLGSSFDGATRGLSIVLPVAGHWWWIFAFPRGFRRVSWVG